MRLLGKDKIQAFQKKHASYAAALDAWVKIVESCDWANPAQVKQTFGARVDFIGKQTVFDVRGNKVRAITKIEYGVRVILITHILDHAEYDKEKWKE